MCWGEPDVFVPKSISIVSVMMIIQHTHIDAAHVGGDGVRSCRTQIMCHHICELRLQSSVR